jgi:ABC-2 type transport system ATP-binding protein
VLVSSHQLAEVAQLADDVIVIHQGRLIAHGPTEELTNEGARTLEDAFLALTEGEDR